MAKKRRSTSPADSQYRGAQEAYRKLASAFSVESSSSVIPGATVPFSGIAPGNKVEAGGLSVEAMRMGNFVRDQRVTTKETPYADIIVRDGTDQDIGIMVGQFEKTWERLRAAGDRGIEWFIEVIVGLSAVKRNRVVRVILNAPEAILPDLSARSVSSHLEAMGERRHHYAKQVDSWNYFFMEKPTRFNGTDISVGARDKNITVDGLLRLISDISERSGNGYAVTGDPVVRVSLESSAGVVLRASHLEQPFHRGIVLGWLYDMVEFTSGTGRDRLWSPARQRFEYVGRDEARRARAEAVGPMHAHLGGRG